MKQKQLFQWKFINKFFFSRVSDTWSTKNKTTHLICKNPSGDVYDMVNRLGGITVRKVCFIFYFLFFLILIVLFY